MSTENDYELDIQDDDYVISDSKQLGESYYCKQVGDFADYTDLLAAIKYDMGLRQCWPDVWYVNDHGNVDLLRLIEKEDGTIDSEIVQSWF